MCQSPREHRARPGHPDTLRFWLLGSGGPPSLLTLRYCAADARRAVSEQIGEEEAHLAHLRGSTARKERLGSQLIKETLLERVDLSH